MMQHYSRSKRTYGRRKSKNAHVEGLARGSAQVNIARWQRVATALEDGSVPLKYFLWNQTPIGTAGDNKYYYPVHVYPLTEFIGNNLVRSNWGAHGIRSTTTAYEPSPITSQISDGSNGANNLWRAERGPFNATSRAYHEWTSMKFRLYGAYGVPTTFRLMVVQFPDETAVPGYGEFSNEKMTEQWNWFTRLNCGAALNGGNSGVPLPFKVIKQATYTIDSLDKSDEQVAGATTTGLPITREGNFKDVKMFMRHGRVRDYTWRYTTTQNPTFAQTNGWDLTDGTNVSKEPDVKPSQRLFLIVTANVSLSTSPLPATPTTDQVITGTTVNSHTIAERRYNPGYDIVLRNKFMTAE